MPEGGVGAYTQGQQMTETAPREGTETPGVFSFKKIIFDIFELLGLKFRGLCMLGKYPMTESHPWP